MYLKTSRHFWLGTVFVSSDFSLVSICTGRTFDLLVSAIRANVVSEKTTHGRPLLHLLQQIPSTMPQHRRSWRPSLRAQPAGPPRPFDDATGSRPGARGTVGNHGQSHRGSGRAVSLALLRRETRFAKAGLLTPRNCQPVSRPSLRMFFSSRVLIPAARARVSARDSPGSSLIAY